MLYAVIGLIVLVSIGLAIYALLNKSEMAAQIIALREEIQEQDGEYSAEIDVLKGKMVAKVSALQKELQEQGNRHSVEIVELEKDSAATIDDLLAELAKLEEFKHIPNVIEKS